jgi:antibiotic biosynthesis monooxygenase (ABM) superfamily enzyme
MSSELSSLGFANLFRSECPKFGSRFEKHFLILELLYASFSKKKRLFNPEFSSYSLFSFMLLLSLLLKQTLTSQESLV